MFAWLAGRRRRAVRLHVGPRELRLDGVSREGVDELVVREVAIFVGVAHVQQLLDLQAVGTVRRWQRQRPREERRT